MFSARVKTIDLNCNEIIAYMKDGHYDIPSSDDVERMRLLSIRATSQALLERRPEDSLWDEFDEYSYRYPYHNARFISMSGSILTPQQDKRLRTQDSIMMEEELLAIIKEVKAQKENPPKRRSTALDPDRNAPWRKPQADAPALPNDSFVEADQGEPAGNEDEFVGNSRGVRLPRKVEQHEMYVDEPDTDQYGGGNDADIEVDDEGDDSHLSFTRRLFGKPIATKKAEEKSDSAQKGAGKRGKTESKDGTGCGKALGKQRGLGKGENHVGFTKGEAFLKEERVNKRVLDTFYLQKLHEEKKGSHHQVR